MNHITRLALVGLASVAALVGIPTTALAMTPPLDPMDGFVQPAVAQAADGVSAAVIWAIVVVAAAIALTFAFVGYRIGTRSGHQRDTQSTGHGQVHAFG